MFVGVTEPNSVPSALPAPRSGAPSCAARRRSTPPARQCAPRCAHAAPRALQLGDLPPGGELASCRGRRKLRAYPRATLTTSPLRPSLSTSSRRMTSIICDVGKEGHTHAPLHRDSHLVLVPAAGAGDPPGADLALLRDVAAKLVDVLSSRPGRPCLAEVAALALPGLTRAARARLPSRFLCLRCHISPLRTDVVVGAALAEVGGLRRGRSQARTAGAPPRAGSPALGVAAAEELHALGDDLHSLALGAVLGVPLAPVEPAVDADGAALAEVRRAALRLVAQTARRSSWACPPTGRRRPSCAS